VLQWLIEILIIYWPITILTAISWHQGWGPIPGAILGGVIWWLYTRRPAEIPAVIPTPMPAPHANASANIAIQNFAADNAAHQQASVRGVPEILSELNSLIGLAEAKQAIAEILATVQASRAREAQGLAPIVQSLHCAFTGAPGTGKTIVARLLGELFCAVGVFPGRPVFVEVTKSDLVAGFVGQTATKVRSICAAATGGVLFVDEAYSLMPSDQGHDFAAEALSELIVRMEDGRRHFCVILAGYPKEIDALIRSNPGMESRLSFRVQFADYTSEELTQIAERELQRRQYGYCPDVLVAIRSRIARHGGKLPGNGRDIRGWVEQAIRNAAVSGRIDTIIPDDINDRR